jgi:hypothetical protein
MDGIAKTVPIRPKRENIAQENLVIERDVVMCRCINNTGIFIIARGQVKRNKGLTSHNSVVEEISHPSQP